MANQAIHNQTTFGVGDLIKINQTVKEKDKERVQTFEGKVISIKGRTPNKSITVRKIGIDNIGVEKIVPLSSPTVSKIEVKRQMREKRAKLYYLRGKVNK